MKFISVFLVPAIVLSCGILEYLFPINYPQRYIEREISNSELVGTWQITTESKSRVNDIIQERDALWALDDPWSLITLNNDGTCEVGLEPSWLQGNKVLKEPDSLSTCTWKIDSILGYDVNGSFKHVPGLFVRFEHYNKQEDMYYVFYSETYIAEENNELILWNFIGDISYLQFQEFMRIDQ